MAEPESRATHSIACPSAAVTCRSVRSSAAIRSAQEKGATTSFTASAYLKFESTPLQGRVQCELSQTYFHQALIAAEKSRASCRNRAHGGAGCIRERSAPASPEALKQHNCLEWHNPQEHLNRWPFRVAGERVELSASGNFRSSNGLSLAGAGFTGNKSRVAFQTIAAFLARCSS